MTKFLGIDYGLAHVGLATSEATLGTPLSTLKNDAQLFDRLLSIIKGEAIDTIVCGIPEGMLAPKVEAFASKLSTISGITVILHPETLTTHDAQQKLIAGGASFGKKQNDHAYAACLILEDYLELTGDTQPQS